MDQSPKSSSRRQALQIAGTYLLVGCLWIALSDRALLLIVPDPAHYAAAQTWKGWFWILTTTVFFYLAVWKALVDRESFEEELRKRDEVLLQSQKLEAVGRLAGGVAHDFNNVLMVIQGYAQILRGYCSKDHVAADDLNQIEHACERATHLTRQLLAFSRKRVSRPQVFDLNEVLESSDRMLRRLIGEDILVSLELTPGPCPVEADPIQFEQVVMNLAVNARDAMPGGGTLRLRTARVDANVVPSAKTAGDHVLLEVSDTGQGMDQRILPQIFEPFFTTKETGQGTGLGLSTVYAIVDQAGGVITVESLEGRGSVFSVWLPLSKRSIQKPPATGDTLPTSRGGETVLLVEDEPAVASLIEGILREAGYSTLVASDGQKALDLAAAHPGPIQLLFSDVVLPHLSGPELAERLCRQRPEIRVLLISGYAERELLGEAAQSLLLVEKPASPQTILRAVRRVLDDPDPQRLRSTDPSG